MDTILDLEYYFIFQKLRFFLRPLFYLELILFILGFRLMAILLYFYPFFSTSDFLFLSFSSFFRVILTVYLCLQLCFPAIFHSFISFQKSIYLLLYGFNARENISQHESRSSFTL